jgi:hypothetical protein
MRKWVILASVFLVIIVALTWLIMSGVQMGKGYVVMGRGVKIKDKATLQQMVSSGREVVGFYHPLVILWAREGLQTQDYALYSVNTQTKSPTTGCVKPTTYFARGVVLVKMDVDMNQIIEARGEAKSNQALNGIVAQCLAYGMASGDASETYQRVWEAVKTAMGEVLVFGGGK